MQWTPEQRQQISEQAKGKSVESLEYEADDGYWDDGYWVLTFDDGSEISFRFMAELARA